MSATEAGPAPGSFDGSTRAGTADMPTANVAAAATAAMRVKPVKPIHAMRDISCSRHAIGPVNPSHLRMN
jgi:hypothetical protein